MNKDAKIYVVGHRGLVGSAIARRLEKAGFTNLLHRTSSELDLRDQAAKDAFFAAEKPEYVFLAAARIDGIHANNTYPADFIRLTTLHVLPALIRKFHLAKLAAQGDIEAIRKDESLSAPSLRTLRKPSACCPMPRVSSCASLPRSSLGGPARPCVSSCTWTTGRRLPVPDAALRRGNDHQRGQRHMCRRPASLSRSGAFSRLLGSCRPKGPAPLADRMERKPSKCITPGARRGAPEERRQGDHNVPIV